MRRQRRGFIILFGSRTIVSNDGDGRVQTTCPNCGQEAQIVGKSYRHWFTVFFIPVFPISGKHVISECSNCAAQFPVSVSELNSRLNQSDQQQSQQAISLYNSLRKSPANSITLNELMTMYASMKEYDQALSAASEFPQALNNSEQCMTTLGRVYLAMNRHEEALQWFDASIARNDELAEAHYYKAVAHLTSTPADYARAVASARTARNLGYGQADGLLREAEDKARGNQ